MNTPPPPPGVGGIEVFAGYLYKSRPPPLPRSAEIDKRNVCTLQHPISLQARRHKVYKYSDNAKRVQKHSIAFACNPCKIRSIYTCKLLVTPAYESLGQVVQHY